MEDRKSLLAELAVARGDLDRIRAANFKRLIDARTALSIATIANLPLDTVCFTDNEDRGVTFAKLSAFIDLLRDEDAHMAELLEIVDRRMAAAARDVDGIQ